MLASYVHLNRLARPTGVGRVVLNMIPRLAAAAGQDMVAIANAAHFRTYIDQLPPWWRGLPYRLFQRSLSLQQLLWVGGLGPRAEDLDGRIDVVYCPAESYIPSRRARLITTVHDMFVFEDPSVNKEIDRLQRAKWRALFAVLERNVDAIHTVSDFSAGRIARFYPGLASRVKVVPLGVDSVFFSSGPPRETIRTLVDGDRPFVFVPAPLSAKKNAELVCDAWPRIERRYPDCALVVLDGGTGPYARRLREGAKRVTFCGFVPDETVHALYRHAAAVWLPSLYEGFGLPALEAMACGTPVVVSRAGSLPEVVGDAALLADPMDADSHCEALAAFLDSPALSQRYGAAGLRQSSRFSWDDSAARLAAQIRALA